MSVVEAEVEEVHEDVGGEDREAGCLNSSSMSMSMSASTGGVDDVEVKVKLVKDMSVQDVDGEDREAGCLNRSSMSMSASTGGVDDDLEVEVKLVKGMSVQVAVVVDCESVLSLYNPVAPNSKSIKIPWAPSKASSTASNNHGAPLTTTDTSTTLYLQFLLPSGARE